MRIGCAHVEGLYNFPDDGEQLLNGAQAIWDMGMRSLKLFMTPDYEADYPEQDTWSDTAETLTELLATDEFTAVMEMGWDEIVISAFTFANGTTNWWRATPNPTKMAAEYTELYNFGCALLTLLDGTGCRIVLQNWEGDWALMDSTTPTTRVDRKFIDYLTAYHGVRQRAVRNARKDTASDCTLLYAVELNRVEDARRLRHRRRILTDLKDRVNPDVISYSSYDTITNSDVLGSVWGANVAAWEAAYEAPHRKALRAIQAAFPGAQLQVGESGFPENEAPEGWNVATAIQKTVEWAEDANAQTFLYWQVFDNEAGTPPDDYRGYWLMDDAGEQTVAGATLEALVTE